MSEKMRADEKQLPDDHPPGTAPDPERLRRLGFSEKMIAGALRLQEAGVVGVEPPADLIDRTIEECRHLFPAKEDEPPEREWNHLFEGVRAGMLAASHPAFDRYADFVTNLSNRCYGSLSFALEHRQRPLMVLDNHNLVDPSSWTQDPLFRSMRKTWTSVNNVARSQNLDPTGVLVVLRPSAKDYDLDQLKTLAQLLDETTSDIWFMSLEQANQHASSYLKRDVVVVGDTSVLKIEVKGDAPGGPIEDVRATEVPDVVSKVRQDLIGCTRRAFPIKSKGVLVEGLRGASDDPSRMRAMIDDVITGAAKAPGFARL